MVYYLGIDVGTTSAKTVAFSETGEVLASHSCTYQMHHPQPGWSEQNPEEVFEAVIKSTNKVISVLPSYKLLLAAFSSAMHGLLLMDKNGQPLTNCIIWADNRAADIADRLKNSDWGKEIYYATGVPVHAMSPLCKLIWLKENSPTVFSKAAKFISIKEYIFYKAFGEYLIDTSVASATGLLNLKTLKWDEKILNFLDISSISFSEVVSTKTKRIYNKRNGDVNTKDWLMPNGTPFIIGSSDGALANIGTGATEKNSMAITIGTSSAARIITNAPETDTQMRVFCYHATDDSYILGGASNNGAVVLEWLKNNLLETQESVSEFFHKAEAVNAGSDDLIFVPYILGERAPIWNSKARGIFFGLSINHTKAHLIRACMEGVIYSVYSIARILLEKRLITEIRASGGFAQSNLWLQMLADVCNIKVLVSHAVESAAFGAVMLGMEAMNIEPFEKKEISNFYQPNLLNHEIYSRGFDKFERIYNSLKDELNDEPAKLFQKQL
jgi:gluconokinase